MKKLWNPEIYCMQNLVNYHKLGNMYSICLKKTFTP